MQFSVPIGCCPTCQGQGLYLDRKKVICDLCRTVWEDSYNMPVSQRNGDRLPTMVTMRLTSISSAIESPSKESVEHSPLITAIVNAAVMNRFKLRSSFSCDGGVEGVFRPHSRARKRYIELENTYGNFGLQITETYMAEDPAVAKVLEWHFRLMSALVHNTFEVGKKFWYRGALFTEDLTETDVILICYQALARYTGSKSKARAVFREITDTKDNLIRRNLAGLSDEDIANIYVEPPAFGT